MEHDDLFTFTQVLSILPLHSIVEVMDTPIYLIPETQINGNPLVYYPDKQPRQTLHGTKTCNSSA